MVILTTATKLGWSEWFRGLIGSFISGGAAAIGATVGVTTFDPSHDIVGIRLLGVAGVSFLGSGIVSLAKFLQQHPLPDDKPKEASKT